MAKKLAKNVIVDGQFYPAGSTPPKDVAAQITNPKAWGDDNDDSGSQEPEEVVVGAGDTDGENAAESSDDTPAEAPRRGRAAKKTAASS